VQPDRTQRTLKTIFALHAELNAENSWGNDQRSKDQDPGACLLVPSMIGHPAPRMKFIRNSRYIQAAYEDWRIDMVFI
jgi:hypothetical protein